MKSVGENVRALTIESWKRLSANISKNVLVYDFHIMDDVFNQILDDVSDHNKTTIRNTIEDPK